MADLQIASENPQEPRPTGRSGNNSLKGVRSGHLFTGLASLIVGLLVGWLLIGWWLWPVEWNNAELWDLNTAHQKTFVDLVAKEFSRGGNVAQARAALAGWNDADLADLLVTMQTQTSDPEARQRLADLAAALALPDRQLSPLTSLVGQNTILLSVGVATLPLVLGLALGISSFLRRKPRRPEQEPTPAQKAQKTGNPNPEPQTTAEPTEQTDQDQATASPTEAEQANVEGRRAEPKESAGAKATKETEPEPMAKKSPGSPAKGGGGTEKAQTEASPPEEADQEELEEPEDDDASIQDILASLFEDEDLETTHLEALCKSLDEIDIEKLLQKSRRIASQLERSNALRLE